MKRTHEECLKILSENNVCELYKSGKSTKELSDLTGLNTETVRCYLKAQGIELRKAKRRESLREITPIGTRFGSWEVISEELKVDSNRRLCQQCKCLKCGEIQWKQISALKAGRSKSCKKCGNKTYLNENGEIDMNNFFISFYNHIKQGLKTRSKVGELEFNITPEYIQDLYEKQNHKCALSGIDITFDKSFFTSGHRNLSLDRIDSNKGYVQGNVQWVDTKINMMKQSYSQEEFIRLCGLVYKNNIN